MRALSTNRIDLWLGALERAFEGTGEIVPWPAHIATIAPYFSDYEAADLFAKLGAISSQGSPETVVPTLLIGPSVTKTTLMDVIIGLKVVRPPISQEQRVWFVESIFDALQTMQHGDIFCGDGKSLHLTPDGAQRLFERIPWIWLDSRQDFGWAAHKASASAQALVWSVYFDVWTDVGFEVHGPYEIILPDGRKLALLVRDFFDAKPVLLWDSTKTFPYDSMRVSAVYDPKANLKIDILNHLTSSGKLLDAAVAMCVEANGRPLTTTEEVEALSREALRQASSQHQLIRKMTREEIVTKLVEIRYYGFRKWRLHFGEDWRPPPAVHQRIREWGLIESPPSDSLDWGQLQKAFDPRTEFVPGASGS